MVGEISERIVVSPPARLPQDLRPRIVSGLVLASVALIGNWVSPGVFAAMVAAIGAVMAWEWAGIVRRSNMDAGLGVHIATVVAAVVLTALGLPGWALMAAAAGAVLCACLTPGRHPLFSAAGVAYVALPAVALVWLRGGDGYGALAILFLFVIVWTTDTFAYVCGRLIGGPKLWPILSPRKTWAGTFGGLFFAGLAGVVFSALTPNTGPLALAVTAVVLSALSQIGDLAESALKRTFLVEHASQLIPGHGGFMDRMDGVVAAASVAALLASSRAAQSPGYALLFWP